jgi:hypothetical protein
VGASLLRFRNGLAQALREDPLRGWKTKRQGDRETRRQGDQNARPIRVI